MGFSHIFRRLGEVLGKPACEPRSLAEAGQHLLGDGDADAEGEAGCAVASSSWLNLVERFFAEITRKRIRRSAFTSVAELEQTIRDDLDQHNDKPKPFVWTKSAEVILDKKARAKATLDAFKTGYQALE